MSTAARRAAHRNAGAVMRGAVLAVAVLGVVACRPQIQLGDPDASLAVDSGVTDVDASPPTCTGAPSRTVVTTADASLGELRAIAVRAPSLYAVYAGPGNVGVLTRVATSGGGLTELASVGLDPAGLAVSADGAFVFVAARGDAKIRRVDRQGGVVIADAGGAPSAIAADDHVGAFWTLPASDTVSSWSFLDGAPKPLVTALRPSAILRSSGVLYLRGEGTISAFVPGVDTAPRKIADHCTAGTPAIDGSTLYCADADAIARIDLVTGMTAVVATAQPGAADVVVGAGRVFWRAAQSPQQSLVMSLPLDGIGGPTVFEGSAPGPLAIALDGCDLYFSAGASIVRRSL